MTEELKTPYEIIVLGDMSGKAKASMWEHLAGQAKPYYAVSNGGYAREQFEDMLKPSEKQYMVEYHMDKPDMYLYPKKGDSYLNKRKYLPSAYRTAKSVACICLEKGVKMHDDYGNVISKSKCEKAYKEKARASNVLEKEEKDGYTEAYVAIGKARRYINTTLLDIDERTVLREEIDKLKEALGELT